MWVLLKAVVWKWLLTRLGLKALASLALFLPIAWLLKAVGIPLLIVLAVLAIPLVALLAIIGFPLLLALIVGGGMLALLFVVLSLGLLMVPLLLVVMAVVWLVRRLLRDDPASGVDPA